MQPVNVLVTAKLDQEMKISSTTICAVLPRSPISARMRPETKPLRMQR